MSHTSTWNVTGMTCGHCAASVTEEIAEIPGVESVEVSHEAGTAVVTSAEPVERAAVEAAVVEAGYELA
ncbi:heavy-metal-associated domain-containing protein [Nocardioides sp. cx-169]|uniref:heavy-metal-associated domain-containing protein n=1 Tax=Nocardioides sp. cx-169 TaxID=2899080 RepID=UPI001E3909FA|nr:heavy-metal-associated domain-containing protein [Nocardioides sp. cx-169]MCD4533701.1 heavy-metal-associated domain-containing protein [Nocardioides sp. cx-169]